MVESELCIWSAWLDLLVFSYSCESESRDKSTFSLKFYQYSINAKVQTHRIFESQGKINYKKLKNKVLVLYHKGCSLNICENISWCDTPILRHFLLSFCFLLSFRHYRLRWCLKTFSTQCSKWGLKNLKIIATSSGICW